jgi:hypothetical protein
MAQKPSKYIFLTDVHWGYEKKSRHLRPIHDTRAINAVLEFAQDFKPDRVILGGDILDCGAVSHHNKQRPGNVEGLRLGRDMEECREAFIAPLEALGAKNYTYLTGNHEDWINDVYIDNPALEGMLDFSLMLSPKWDVVDHGRGVALGKLYFMHGDQIKGGEHVAKQAWQYYGRSVRFGHFHTFQAHTPKRAMDSDILHTAICVPCLSRRDPAYGENKPNSWLQGFNFGYVMPNGHFSDYTPIITNGTFIANGKLYGKV